MKSSHRIEEDPPVDGDNEGSRDGFFVAGELRLLDAAIGLLQRLRDRIAPPVEDEDAWHGRKKAAAHVADAPALEAVALPKPRRLRNFLLVVAAMLASGLAGMDFSYSALSKIIRSNDLLLDDLRDEIAQYRKQESRSVNAAARYQQKLEENDKRIADYQQQLADHRHQIEELLAQASAASGNVRANPAQFYAGGAARSRPPAREKTGNCVMGTATATTDLTRCVEQFNR